MLKKIPTLISRVLINKTNYYKYVLKISLPILDYTTNKLTNITFKRI